MKGGYVMSASRDEKTGKWTVQCYYENWKGEKKHKKKRGFATKKEALELIKVLNSKDIGATFVKGEGAISQVHIVEIVIGRKSLNEVIGIISDFDSKVYTIRNLWTNQNEGDTKKVRPVTIPGHDVVMYRLSVAKKKK